MECENTTVETRIWPSGIAIASDNDTHTIASESVTQSRGNCIAESTSDEPSEPHNLSTENNIEDYTTERLSDEASFSSGPSEPQNLSTQNNIDDNTSENISDEARSSSGSSEPQNLSTEKNINEDLELTEEEQEYERAKALGIVAELQLAKRLLKSCSDYSLEADDFSRGLDAIEKTEEHLVGQSTSLCSYCTNRAENAASEDNSASGLDEDANVEDSASEEDLAWQSASSCLNNDTYRIENTTSEDHLVGPSSSYCLDDTCVRRSASEVHLVGQSASYSLNDDTFVRRSVSEVLLVGESASYYLNDDTYCRKSASEVQLVSQSGDTFVRKCVSEVLLAGQSASYCSDDDTCSDASDNSSDHDSIAEIVTVNARFSTNVENVQTSSESLQAPNERGDMIFAPNLPDTPDEPLQKSPKKKRLGKRDYLFHYRVPMLIGGVTIIDDATSNIPPERECCTCSTMIQKYSNSYLDYWKTKEQEITFDTSVLALPDTTLLKIFSYLNEEQVCNVASVCHEWKRVAYDSSLWSSVDLRRYHTALDELSLAKLIRSRMTPLLHKLNLGGSSLTQRVFKILANECPKLRILSLESVTFLDKFSSKDKNFPGGLDTLDVRHSSGDTSAFCAVARALDSIESLGVSDQFLTSLLGTNDLEPLFFRLSRIKVLEFSYCSSLTDTMMGYVAMHCPLLESLCLRRCNTFHGASLPFLLTSCPRITSLVLDGTAITDGALRAPDWSSTNITELDLSWCRHLSHEGLKSALSRLPGLRYLRLCCVGYGHGVTDDVLHIMALAKCEDLKILDVSYSSLVTDDGLSDFIGVCQGLLYLRINHCRSTTPRLMDLLPANSQVFVVANFPIDSDVPFNRELLRYTYWPTPIFMRNFGLDIEMGWQ